MTCRTDWGLGTVPGLGSLFRQSFLDLCRKHERGATKILEVWMPNISFHSTWTPANCKLMQIVSIPISVAQQINKQFHRAKLCPVTRSQTSGGVEGGSGVFRFRLCHASNPGTFSRKGGPAGADGLGVLGTILQLWLLNHDFANQTVSDQKMTVTEQFNSKKSCQNAKPVLH